MSEAAIENRNVTLESAYQEARDHFVRANPESARAYQAAQQSMPGGNTRSVLHFDPFPLTFVHAEGARLRDVDGHRYIDLLGEYTAGLYGHSHPVIVQAIEQALHSGIVRGGPSATEAGFARAVCDRFPAIELVRFCNSGTEANVYALSTACAFTGRTDVIVMQSGYHGGVLYFASDCPLNMPIPFHLIPYNDVEAATAKIGEIGDRLAAVIVEPMLGGGGCFPGTPEFLGALRSQTERVGALLIFDEVMTSRLAPGGLHGALGLTPDLVTLGKYVGGGMTFGAFGGRRDIMSRFDPRNADAWPHAGTFNNNVLTMAAGLAGLTQVYTSDAVTRLNGLGDTLRETLMARAVKLGVPVQVTGCGSMMNIHFGRQLPAAPRAVADVPKSLKALLHLDLIDQGFYIAQRGMVNLSLAVTEADTAAFAEAFETVLANRATVIEQSLS